jgi:hypothetical protein
MSALEAEDVMAAAFISTSLMAAQNSYRQSAALFASGLIRKGPRSPQHCFLQAMSLQSVARRNMHLAMMAYQKNARRAHARQVHAAVAAHIRQVQAAVAAAPCVGQPQTVPAMLPMPASDDIVSPSRASTELDIEQSQVRTGSKIVIDLTSEFPNE